LGENKMKTEIIYIWTKEKTKRGWKRTIKAVKV